MRRVVILAAGRSSRLGGKNKLLVKAGNKLVAEWHRQLLANTYVAAVVRPSDFYEIDETMPWLSCLLSHKEYDGPAGALLSYLNTDTSGEPLTVLFADTLLRELPDADGDWVGIAQVTGRVWDYWDGEWTRGVPFIQVCVGAYQFSCMDCLKGILRVLIADNEGREVSMAEVLRRYDGNHMLEHVHCDDWQDAGDPEAIAKVEE